jgi:hypothetical protein
MITEQLLLNLHNCDEYSLRHHASEVWELVEAFKDLRALAHDLHPVLLQRDQSTLAYRERLARRIEAICGKPPYRIPGARQ